MTLRDAKALRTASLETPTDLKANAVKDVAGALNIVLADMFALYVKTKNFHWHVSGPHFRDYHLLLDEQAGSSAGRSASRAGALAFRLKPLLAAGAVAGLALLIPAVASANCVTSNDPEPH